MVSGGSGSHSTAIEDLPEIVARVAESDVERIAVTLGTVAVGYGDLHRELTDLDAAMGGVLGADALVPLALSALAPGAVDTAEGGLQSIVDTIGIDARELLGDMVPSSAAMADTLPSRFRAQVESTPDAVAVVFEGVTLTYAEFDARVNTLARRLVELGVGPDVRVGLSMSRSVDLLVSMYAIVEAGGAYVPLDPAHPADRIAYVLDIAEPALVVTTTADRSVHAGRVPELIVDTEDLSGYAAAPLAADERPLGAVRPDNTAYVIFTSGSTGRPKGVAVSHAAIVANLDWRQRDYPLTPADVVLQKTPFTFDVSVWEFFWPLQSGASIVVAAPDGHRDPKYIADAMVSHGVTTAHFVPSMLAVFLGQFETSSNRTDRIPSLRQVFASGEALPAGSAARFHTLFDAELHNLYGPTEAAVDVTYHRTDGHDVVSVPIGVAVPNTELHVLDEGLNRTPPGVPGELYLAGVQLARGYLGRPDLTADRFVADVHGTRGARMYRTGDLVRRRADGALEYLGRTDFQVKLRGLRIELGEIEAALSAQDDVRQATVIVLSDDSETGVDDRLVAYVVTTSGRADADVLAAVIRGRLPDYMVPAVFVALDEFPVNASGKLDRAALPKPDTAALTAEYRAPATDVERALVSVLEDVLGVERFGVDDDFFVLGGNSLSATRAIARVNADLKVKVDVRGFFDSPTVAGLAVLVEEARSSGVGVRAPLTRRERPDQVPLSLAQQRMWFLNRLDPDSAVDNIPVAIRLSGVVDKDSLAAAVDDVVDRHEALRTMYPEAGGIGHQVVCDSADAIPRLEVDVVDEADVYERVVEMVSRGFDVTAEVPVRLRLLEVSETEHIVVVVAHHIAADGFSMAPLTRDIVSAYVARSAGTSPEWTPLEVQYADFALWQREILGSEDDPASLISAQEHFWTEALADAPEQLDLPSDRRRPAVASGRGATYSVVVDAATRARIDALASRHSATSFMVVHAALSVLLARLSGTDDVVVGTPVAGRGEQVLDDLVGMFVNTLVLRARVNPRERFTDLVAAVRRTDLDAFGNADVPFERLVEVLEPTRSRARHPLFQVLLVFQNLETSTLELPGLTVSGVEFDSAVAKLDLQITVSERGSGPETEWALDFTYATDLFDEGTIAALASRFSTVLDAVGQQPDISVGEIEIVTPEERVLVLDTWNATEQQVDDRVLLDAFHRTARRIPDGVALSYEDQKLTFAEFSSRVTVLARYLIELGVGPDVLTAVAIPRSVDMVVALYAVVEAGGGYVPIDPDQPAERNEYILEASAAPLVLTTSTGTFSPVDRQTVEIDRVDLAGYTDGAVSDVERLTPLHSDHVAYVIFTSGSTGRPKGVAVSHRAVVNQISWIVSEFGLGDHDVILHKTPFTFDVSIWELFGAPASGAQLVLARPDGHRDAAYLAEIVEAKRITATSFVPSMVPAFSTEISARDASTLRLVQLAGEALPASTVQALARATEAQIHNLYGPTEFTVHATSRAVSGVDGRNLSDTTAPMGSPVWNTSAYVLDAGLQPVPVGVAGELYLAGVQNARGYHGRPGLTAERFVADPYRGGRLYRTGDVVRWNAAGELEYIGRSDFQVKLRGLRIELGEIETIARTVSTVADAVAAVGQDRLVLYVVAVDTATIDTGELRSALGRELPSYMVPAVYVVLDELPTNAAGKLDRAALPEPELDVRAFRAPSTPIEEIVARVFEDVLGTPRVGADDDFFALGGNSLVATQVVSRLGAELDAAVPVRLLFEVSTVSALAVRIESEVGRGARLALERRVRPERVPLSMAQQRMWFLNRLEPDSAANNIPIAIRLSGLLDRRALQVAVADVLARHESLRTVYPEIDGVGYQEVVSTASVVPDLAPIPVDQEQLASSIEEIVLAGFDVADRAPFRAVLFEVSSTEHVLVLVVHHIAADGYSLGPLTRDVVRAYTARATGLDLAWEPLPVQYADYTLWQRDVLGSEYDPESIIAAQKSFWRNTLAGLPEQLNLPFDRPRPAVASNRGRTHRFEISPAVRRAVEDVAAQRRSTPFMVVHAATAVLLAQLSGTDDIAIGAPIAGRGEPALDDMIGMFVNTLVLRTQVSPSATFEEILAGVREGDLAAFANADIPFERLVEILDPARSTARHPLFQVALFFQNLGTAELELPDLSVSAVDFDAGIAKFDLQIAVMDTAEGDGWTVEFVYATDLFDASGVDALQTRLLRVLGAVTADPEVVVGDIGLSTEPEVDRLVSGWNATDHELPDAGLLDGFAAIAAEHPDSTALRYEGDSLTYGDFAARVNDLAHVLAAAGAGPETLVALAVRRSIDLVVAMYAVLRAGAGFVPVDPDHPLERIGYVLDAAEPVCVVTRSGDEFVPPGTVPVVDVHAVPDAAEASVALRSPVSAESVAYVIFTSGSTGKPKGVAVGHRAIVNQMEWMQSQYPLGSTDVYLQKTATTFDVSLWGFFLPLRVGATLVLATPDGHRDPGYLSDIIARHSVTVTDFVPTMLSVFAAAVSRSALRTLRDVFVIGEALSADAVREFSRVSQARVHNLYGPTEAAVSITYADVTDVPAGAAVTIGVPEWNSAAYVLNSRLAPVPVGVPGELYLAGVQLARGYHGRVDLTAERFVANPFVSGAVSASSRMYRTGDLVTRRRDGSLDYIGRTDFQVKFRGQRIELGEIEAALLAHPTVGLAAVQVVSTDAGDQLVGYVVPSPAMNIDVDQVRASVADTLPRYMIPAAMMILEEFPLNTSGKLDRKSLPAPEFATVEFRAPSNPIEEIVAGVFADVLGIDRIGLDDDFFALGGNSLVATQLVSRLGAALDSRVAVRTLFEASTVQALAARVESNTGGRVALTALPRPDRIPLSMAQQRMWFLNRLEPESAVNNIPAAVRLSGTIDVSALTAAIDDVVARHEILRTVYPESAGTGIQVILPVDAGRVDFEMRSIDESEVFAAVVSIVTEGFDVTRVSPVRIRLLEIGDREHILVVIAHHIAADGFSMNPLMRDVVTAYVARAGGDAPQWTPLAVQYADYTLWQRQVLGSSDDPGSLISTQESYWRSALSGLPEVLELPTDRARPSVASGRGGSHTIVLDEQTSAAIDRLAAQRGSTAFMVVHAALAVLLSRLSGSADVVVGTPVAGRGEAVLDDVIGMFVNTLVLRTAVDGSSSFDEVLAGVREVDLSAFAHADVPFERVVEVVDPPRLQGVHPLVQVLLTFANFESSSFEIPGLTASPVDFDSAVAKMDLQVTVGEPHLGADGTRGRSVEFVYATDLFEPETVARLGRQFADVLDVVTKDSTVPVGDIDLLAPTELAWLVDEINATEHAVDSSATLVSMFDAQVAESPDAVALRFDGESLTYREFDARANRLARYLVAEGVGPEVCVAVAMQRSVDLMVALYAVIKAGGAYVPLDPEQPADRIRYIVETSNAALALSTSNDAFPSAVVSPVLVDGLILDSFSDAPLSDKDRVSSLTADNGAYVLFTSGSTGKPKGVTIDHRAIVNRLVWMQDKYPISESDVVAQKTPVTFDVSVWELFWPLQVGATLAVAVPDGHRDPAYLAQFFASERVTVTHFVPSMLAVFGAEPTAARAETLRLLFASGEALAASTARNVQRALPSVRVINLYGPTEAAVDVTFHEFTDADTAGVPIGVPVFNTQVYVLDTRLRPVAVGAVGELYLGGEQLARGYAARPDLTSDRFVADPYSDTGSRLYRTGDLVRWTSDGEIEYIGRADFQVKLRGLRIELGEVENAILGSESVSRAVVLVRDDRLVGYVVPNTGAVVDVESLERSLSDALPAYMVPSAFVVLDELPLGSAGKLDRRALPDPVLVARDFREPSSETERIVAAVFADVLGLTRVGLDDDFFELGGNSLVATQVVARAGGAVDASIPVRLLFDASTVAAFSSAVAGLAGTGGRPPLVAVERPERIPLSLAQQRMWVLNNIDPESGAYNIPLAVRLSGELDVDALRSAVTDVVARHESLRTMYPSDAEGPEQRILTAAQVPSDLVPKLVDGPEAARREVAALVLGGFDVTAGVPVRMGLVQLSPTEHVLALVVHHISADGASIAPLARDVMVAYSARSRGERPEWTDLPVQYADFALWQRRVLGTVEEAGSIASEQLAYWTETLAGAPDLVELPTDRPRPSTQSMQGGSVDFRLDSTSHAGLVEFARDRGTSLFMIVHASLAILLGRLSGSSDIVVGTPVAGRGAEELDELVGMFVNTLALRTEVDFGGTFSGLVDDVRAQDLGAFGHPDLPFESIVDALLPVRSQARHPIFQVALSFQNLERVRLELPGLTVEALDVDELGAKFDLQFTIEERTDGSGRAAGLFGSLLYARDLFDESTAHAFADRLVLILRTVAADPYVIVGDIDITSEQERQDNAIRVAANTADTRATRSAGDRLLPQVFGSVVELDPEAPAIADDGEELSYLHIEGRSARLARILIDRGIGPGDRVVVALPVSADWAVAVLAIASAGAAVVLSPVHTEVPSLVRESQAVAVLGTSDSAVSADVLSIAIDDPATLDAIAAASARPIEYSSRTRLLGGDDPAVVLAVEGESTSLTHEEVVARVTSAVDRLGITVESRVLAAPDAGDVWQLFSLLACVVAGGTWVVPVPESDGTILDTILDEWVTHAVVDSASTSSLRGEEFEDLEAIIVTDGKSGEADSVAPTDVSVFADEYPFDGPRP
ncbi:amino acid adenylation domain-containing protein [Rhodococcus sp. IEGM 1370]|uniref:non-ribosomal peptide synthetase n=1 Tax=Rhodococcus sp. IEGM 1370 TaxID=3082222 RepID=UPI002952CBC7|nr:non-ribosomal peptide synthetase [Rhodococcus sp. IEGM 1370]MDV8075435.1 amino acid adenylation domain-containing protein [Rhodococcus sp. IEGM 1370]